MKNKGEKNKNIFIALLLFLLIIIMVISIIAIRDKDSGEKPDDGGKVETESDESGGTEEESETEETVTDETESEDTEADKQPSDDSTPSKPVPDAPTEKPEETPVKTNPTDIMNAVLIHLASLKGDSKEVSSISNPASMAIEVSDTESVEDAVTDCKRNQGEVRLH